MSSEVGEMFAGEREAAGRTIQSEARDKAGYNIVCTMRGNPVSSATL